MVIRNSINYSIIDVTKEMLTRCMQQLARSVSSRMASTCPWKTMEYYYNYDFCNKMEFIDHKIRFPLFRVLDVQGKLLAPEYDTLDKEFLLNALTIMITSREMDTVYANAQRQNRISFYITGTYEEATAMGAISATKPTDALFFQYREFPMLMSRGMTTLEYLHNIKGNREDKMLGRGMPLVNANVEQNIFPVSAPLGTRNPHAAGAGYFFRTQKQDRIAICTFGEGAASEGDVHASLNFAATLGSQTLFLCRNNGYAISTFREDQYAGDGVAPRGIGYGIPAIKVDGNDLLAVYHAVKKAREMIMERNGPVLVEAYTYRGGDHTSSDSAASYRTPDRMGPVLKYFDSIGDPIVRLANFMKNKGYLQSAEDTIKAIGAKVRTECLDNLKKIDNIKMPYYNLMFDDVYSQMPWNLKEQKEEFDEHMKKHPGVYPVHDFPQ